VEAEGTAALQAMPGPAETVADPEGLAALQAMADPAAASFRRTAAMGFAKRSKPATMETPTMAMAARPTA
jgi:hypothetical protein